MYKHLSALSSKDRYKFDEFSAALEEVLRIEQLSPADFSRRTGKAIASVSRYLSGKTVPYPRTIKELNKYLSSSRIEVGKNRWYVIEEQPNNSEIKNKANLARQAVGKVESEQAEYTTAELTRADVLRYLEVAEGLMRTCRIWLDRDSADDS